MKIHNKGLLCIVWATFLLHTVLWAQTTKKVGTMKPKVIYVFDPLCGWCYGFSPVIKALEAAYRQNFDFEVVCGGMVVGSRVGPITQIAPYISNAYKQVEAYSGIKFGNTFLTKTLWDSTIQMNSVPPSVALVCFRDEKPELAISYAHSLQAAFYFDGTPLIEPELFATLAAKYGVDKDRFIQKLNDKQNYTKTVDDFSRAASLGVNGYPTVILVKDGKQHILSRGYASYQELEKELWKYK